MKNSTKVKIITQAHRDQCRLPRMRSAEPDVTNHTICAEHHTTNPVTNFSLQQDMYTPSGLVSKDGSNFGRDRPDTTSKANDLRGSTTACNNNQEMIVGSDPKNPQAYERVRSRAGTADHTDCV